MTLSLLPIWMDGATTSPDPTDDDKNDNDDSGDDDI